MTSHPGLPAAYCPSCQRALDTHDERAMAALGMCAWCRDGSRSRRAEARDAALRAVVPTAAVGRQG